MLPIILDPKALKVLLIGQGRATDKRIKLLQESGIEDYTHHTEYNEQEIDFTQFNLVYVGDFDNETSARIAEKARAHKIFINVEDKKPYCDFHVPAIHRSGVALITSSTNGTSPRLSRKIKEVLSRIFDADFAKKSIEIASERQKLMEQGADYGTLLEKADEDIKSTGIFAKFCERCRGDN